MKTILSAITIFLCFLSNGSASKVDPVVSIRAIAPSQAVPAGGSGILTVELTITSPYHINSDRPLQDYLIPTSIEFQQLPNVTFGEPVFPKAEVKKLPVSDSPMAVYEGVVKISAEVRPAAAITQSEIVVQGRVHSQACDNNSCLPPTWQPFSVTVPILKQAQPPASAASTSIPASGPSGVANPPQKGTEGPAEIDFGNRSIFIALVLVFFGGLALNLTPCVYPMIPITITYFGGQAGGKKGNLVAHSFTYVIGMAITYSILGVAAAMTGGLFGAALQYPPVLAGIALIMILLALSMFDVYELRMPAFLNRLAGTSQSGLLGTLLMGVTVGIVAAPCIGPFVLGLLTYVGNRGSVLLGFLLFFALALGLGFPFILLGIFSGSLNRLPRSGAWMVWVRKAFGFILLAMAIYFVKNLLPGPLTYSLALALIMLLAGIYLAWIDPVPNAGKTFSILRNAVGALFFAVAVYILATGLPAGLEKSRTAAGEQVLGDTVRWISYSEEMLQQASRESKPVFIDFFADWCAPCKELDSKTFSTPEVIQRSRQFVMFKVDLTDALDTRTEALRKKYQIRGVPTLVFLQPDGQEISDLRGTGFESKEIFLDKMARALQSRAKAQQDGLLPIDPSDKL